MFICPECNLEVADPDYKVPPRRRWERRLFRPRVPMCPSGHRLRGIMGNSSETFLLTAFLFGLKNSILLLVLGMLEDAALVCRTAKHAPHWPMMVVTAYALVLGSVSLIRAWNWSANQGPVQRLTTRAFGVAVGYLIPAIVAAHAIYFHWLLGLESFFGREFVTLLGSHFRA